MKQINPELLLEVARLLKRYPANDWRDLLTALNDEQSLALLKELAETMSNPSVRARASSIARPAHIKMRERPISAVLREMRDSEPKKAEMLTKFRTLALGKQVLDSMSEIRSFANSIGLKFSNDDDREKFVNDMVRVLASKTFEEVRGYLSSIPLKQSDLGEDYERWVRIILGETQKYRDSGGKP